MKPRRSRVVRAAIPAVLVSSFLLPLGETATATTPNPWHKIGTVEDNFNQPGLVVDPNGTLHIVWVQPDSNSTATLVHTSASLTGAIGTTTTVQSQWAAIWAVPDLLTSSSGLQAFWGGIRTTNPGETNTDVSTATSPADGSSWTLHPGNVAQGAGDYASNIGAAYGANNVPLFSWAATQGVYVHAGLDPSTTDYEVQGQLGGCCGYDPDIAVDPGTGTAWIVWASNATNHVGVYAQQLDPTTGAPIGSAARLPGSATRFNGEDQFDQQIERAPVAASKSGVYVAYTGGYPDTNKILLWRLTAAGPSAARVIASGDSLRTPGIAADANGRVWVTWSRHGLVHARRSDPSVQRFGATASVSRLPAGDCQSLYELTPAAALPVLDVVANYSVTCSSQQALLLAQLYPGLTVTASPSSFTGKQKVAFTVTDAGVPVPGATVSAGGKSDSTDAHGHATIVLGPVSKKRRISAVATKHYFTAGRTSVVAKPN